MYNVDNNGQKKKIERFNRIVVGTLIKSKS